MAVHSVPGARLAGGWLLSPLLLVSALALVPPSTPSCNRELSPTGLPAWETGRPGLCLSAQHSFASHGMLSTERPLPPSSCASDPGPSPGTSRPGIPTEASAGAEASQAEKGGGLGTYTSHGSLEATRRKKSSARGSTSASRRQLWATRGVTEESSRAHVRLRSTWASASSTAAPVSISPAQTSCEMAAGTGSRRPACQMACNCRLAASARMSAGAYVAR
mmetsp:Transcript_40860/g.81858  ORF Transcript_40860/g.81858 Transcript_40860/m.81858 type:complete len:220 (+) Transcript_40860:186-845(+)